MRVEHEADPLPFVAIVATLIRRSLAQRESTTSRLSGIRSTVEAGVTGTVVLRSLHDPQAATLDVERQLVTVRRGVAPNADVTITLDLDDPDAKPKVEGAARHPALAVLVGTLLDAPVRDWEVEAADFFARALADPDSPRPVRVVASDEGTERWFGLDNTSPADPVSPASPTAQVEIHAAASVLAESLSGSKILTEEVLAGRVQLVGDLRMLSVLTGHAIDHAMGNARRKGGVR